MVVAATDAVTECGDCDQVNEGDVRAAQAGLIAPATARELAALFKALSDPTRVRIMSALARREFCVNDLAAALEMTQSAVSHQLSDLRELRVVRYRRDGRHIFYRLDDEHVEALFAEGLGFFRLVPNAGLTEFQFYFTQSFFFDRVVKDTPSAHRCAGGDLKWC